MCMYMSQQHGYGCARTCGFSMGVHTVSRIGSATLQAGVEHLQRPLYEHPRKQGSLHGAAGSSTRHTQPAPAHADEDLHHRKRQASRES